MLLSSHSSAASSLPSPHIGTVPLLDDELDELLDEELLDDELDDALDALLAEDELDAPLDDEALDALLDDELSKLESLLMSIAPSVSKAQASARTLKPNAQETTVQIVNERDLWRIKSACPRRQRASSGRYA
jgi:hypothetical protein